MGVQSSIRPIFIPALASVRGDGSAVLDTSNLHSSSGQRPQGRLSSGSGGLGSVSASSSQLDVKSSNSQSLHLLSHILSGQHSGVGGGLISVSLDLHVVLFP